MSRRLMHLGAALFFFALGCAVTSFLILGEAPHLASTAQAGGCYANLKNTSSMVSGDNCVYTLVFDRPVTRVQMNSNKVIVTFDNRCQYNCQRYNPALGTCAGAHMNSCY